jgi:aspartate/methionine/tyrosine aminotransferase
LASKLLEVCSTTLPQFVLPEIYENENYKISLKERIEKYQTRADLAEKYL